MIELRHMDKAFEETLILEDVNAVINDGDVISVIGPSGAGKSTLLRCINLLSPPTGGQIFLNDEEITSGTYDVTKARQRIGMVFQSFDLFDHLTVIENLMLSQTEILRRTRQQAYDKSMLLLKQVGLADKALKYPKTLSGGQKQRVAIARALAMDPEMILFDEPTSALDPSMVGEVEAVIRSLSENGTTMMIVTHDMAFARSICNRVFYLDDKKIYEEGTPDEIFEHPKLDKTRRFIKQLKTLSFDMGDNGCDFYELSGRIDEFCRKNRLSSRMSYRIRSVIEELCQQIILTETGIDGVNGVIDYSSDTDSANITITYTGERFDPFGTDNELALKVIAGMSDEHSYDYNDNDHLNTADISIRQSK